MLSAWAVLAAPLAAAFVITAPSAANPLVAGRNNTIAWNATEPNTEAEPPSHFSIEVKTNGQWIPLGYEFADVPSDAGAINIQPLGSGYETAVRFVADGEVLASTEDFTVQPPSFQKRDGEEGQPAAVAPAATSVGESLLLAPSAPSAASGDGDAAPAADTEEGSLILAPSATDSSSDASTPSSSESATTARVANGPGKAGPAPTPGATIVADGTTLTLSEDTATVESPEAAPTGASADSKTGALSSKGESTESKDSHKASTGSPSSSGPLRLINDGDELSSNAGSAGIITPGTLTAVAASAGPSLQLASGDEEGSLILAPGTATAGGMGAGGAGAGAGSAATEDAKGGLAVASQSAGAGASASHKAAAADAAGAKQGSGGVSLRPSVIVSILAGIAALTL